jgi:hypothetical protein
MKSLATALFIGLLTAATASAQCTWVNQTTSVVETCGSIGIGTTSPTAQLHVFSNVNGAAPQMTIQNANAGTGAASNFQVVNDAGIAFQFGITSSVWAPLGSIGPSTSAVYSNSANGFMMIADNPAGALRFAPGGHVEKARFDAAGNLGIGTTSPEVSLHIATESTASPRGLLIQQAVTSVSSAFAVFRKSRGTLAAPSVVLAGDNIGTLYGEGYDGTAYTRGGANIKVQVSPNGTVASGVMPTDLVFSTGTSGSGSEVMRATYDGRVGIGTSTPASGVKLHVVGNAQFDGTVSGTFIKAQYQDVAEWVPAKTSLDPGTVVVLDPSAGNGVMASVHSYDTTVAGVVSSQPGIVLGQEGDSKEKVATTGRVRVKVDASRGVIAVGDLLVTSDKPGYAMRSVPVDVAGIAMHRPGTIIGKALQNLAAGEGEILVLLSLQ